MRTARFFPPSILMGVMLWVATAGVWAAVFTVDRSDDTAAATGCDDTAPNDCSLRGAIIKANTTPGADTINLPAGTYTLTIAGAGEDSAATGDLDITSDLTIEGAGATTTVINGVAGDRVFHIDPNGGTSKVSINKVTVQNGSTVLISFVSAEGGGILIGSTATAGDPVIPSGMLTLTDCIVQGNSSASSGGGIANKAGTLILIRSRVSNNAAADGGGIRNRRTGTTTVTDSVINNNSASGRGGGIFNLDGRLTVLNSTISGNTGQGGGGGIFAIGSLTMTNSTVSGNTGSVISGGGLGLYNSSGGCGPHTLNNNTITNNQGSGIALSSGGLGECPVSLSNTIVAGNAGPDCSGTFSSQGYNLVQNIFSGVPNSPPVCSLVGNTTGNIIGQDPKLGGLTVNGGTTPTHALLNGSPAIDAGNSATPGSGGNACAVSDQRGFIRPQGTACDIGAFEFLGEFSVSSVQPNTGGNTGTVVAMVFGNGFEGGATVKLKRAGEPDIVGNPTTANGSVISTTFDLTGKATGSWDVVVMNPDGTSKTMAGAFTIEEGRAPELWVDILGRPFFRTGRRVPGKYFVLFGNRGNVDALGVPLSLSIPSFFTFALHFQIAPPPSQAGQVRSDWSGVPIDVLPDAQNGGVTNIPLLLPVVPAGFTGVLELTLTPPSSGQSELVAAIDPPLFNPNLDSRDVNSFVQEVQTYAQENLGVTIHPELVPNLEQYLRTQLLNVVTNGRQVLTASAGSQIQVYSLAQLKIDLALFGVVRTLTASTNPFGQALQKAHNLLSELPELFVSLLFNFGHKEAMAQGVSVPPQPNGCPPPPCKNSGPLPAGCPCRTSDENFEPPPIPPAPGCNPKDPSTYGNCQLTKEHCEALPNHKVVKKGDGLFCVPNKKPKNCPEIPIPNPHLGAGNADCGDFPIRDTTALDPNDKVGTLGTTEAQFLFSGLPLNYTIHFENLETAAAPAQEVTIADQLDVNTVDLDTFSLGSISFGDIRVTPAPGVSQYIGGVDLRPDQNLIVQITAGLDKSTGIVTWHFTSADPTTLQLTGDALAGFLPPNMKPPEGEGSVLFSVMPKKNLATGTTICNQATIVFDVNAAIDTPQWCNTLDNTKPQSEVLPLAATQASPTFQIQWTGTDTGSGIGDYSIFVSENGGPFSPFVRNTTDTSATFTGKLGSTYAFYSVARDLTGNEEEAPTTPDAITQISLSTCAVNITPQVSVTRGGFRRVSSTGRYVQQITLKNNGTSAVSGPVSLALDNLSGNATLFNKAGDTSCATPISPYKSIGLGADNVLSPGESAAVVLEFTNPSNQSITYGTRVLAGTPQ